jgi:hypothetical protein
MISFTFESRKTDSHRRHTRMIVFPGGVSELGCFFEPFFRTHPNPGRMPGKILTGAVGIVDLPHRSKSTILNSCSRDMICLDSEDWEFWRSSAAAEKDRQFSRAMKQRIFRMYMPIPPGFSHGTQQE